MQLADATSGMCRICRRLAALVEQPAAAAPVGRPSVDGGGTAYPNGTVLRTVRCILQPARTDDTASSFLHACCLGLNLLNNACMCTVTLFVTY